MNVPARLTDAPDDWLEACPGQPQLTAQLRYVGPEVILIDDFPNCHRVCRIFNRLEFSGWKLFANKVNLAWCDYQGILHPVLSGQSRWGCGGQEGGRRQRQNRICWCGSQNYSDTQYVSSANWQHDKDLILSFWPAGDLTFQEVCTQSCFHFGHHIAQETPGYGSCKCTYLEEYTVNTILNYKRLCPSVCVSHHFIISDLNI